MPWNSFILITVLFGVIYGNRPLDVNNRYGYNRYNTKSGSSGSDFEPAASNTKNDNEKYLKNFPFIKDPPKRRFYDIESKLLNQMFSLTEDRGQNEDDNAISYKLNLEGSALMDIDSETKKEFFSPNFRNLVDSTETFSDIVAVDTAKPTQLAKTVEVANAGRNINDFKSKMMMEGLREGEDFQPTSAQLPTSYRSSDDDNVDFYKDLLVDFNKEGEDVKRSGNAPAIGCDCKIKNDVLDLGQQHFPRYLLNAICQTEQSPNEYQQKCWRGSYCKPLEYKVKVLTFRTIIDHGQKDAAMAWLPDDLRQLWKFKTVTVAAGCFCSF